MDTKWISVSFLVEMFEQTVYLIWNYIQFGFGICVTLSDCIQTNGFRCWRCDCVENCLWILGDIRTITQCFLCIHWNNKKNLCLVNLYRFYRECLEQIFTFKEYIRIKFLENWNSIFVGECECDGFYSKFKKIAVTAYRVL